MSKNPYKRRLLATSSVGAIAHRLHGFTTAAPAYHAIVEQLFRDPAPGEEITCFPLSPAERRQMLAKMQAEYPDDDLTLRDAPNYVAREGDILGYGDTRSEAIRQVREGLKS